MKPRNADHDVIIVGNGLAALTLALSLPESLRIALLCKYRLDDNASSRAQGGIAAVLDRLDRLDDHVADTLVAGAGLCDEAAVRAILSQGRAAIEWLIGTGVPFSRADNGSLHLTREGGHGASRIAHVADHTGLSIMQALYRAVASRPNIRQLEQTMAVDLLQDDEDRCVGVRVLNQGQLQPMLATSVVLASGGCGQVYARTTTPTACTGDGIAMAFRAGCAAANMAFMQFHPTGFAGHAGPSRFLTDIGAGLSDTDRQEPIFLISEAVRGEGGILRNEAGERFMPRYDERAELAPRDIVARAIAAEIGRQSLPHVWLDISHRPRSFILEHFPTIHAHCLAHGIDITRSPIPVGPVQHYTCGGIVCDTAGHTQVENLFCLGEAACTGLHGANRLASNSLLECVVMGRNAARAIADGARWHHPMIRAMTMVSKHDMVHDAPSAPRETTVAAADRDASAPFAQSLPASRLADESGTALPPFDRRSLQALVSQHLGILRSTPGLAHAHAVLTAWQARVRPPASVSGHEDLNLLTCARIIEASARQCPTSIGAHCNVDLTAAPPPTASTAYRRQPSAQPGA